MMPAATLNSRSNNFSKLENALSCAPRPPAGVGRAQVLERYTSPVLEAYEQAECSTDDRVRNPVRRHWWSAAWVSGLLLTQTTLAQSPAPPSFTNALALAQQTHETAVAKFKQSPDNLEVAWLAGRSCFELAEFPEYKGERAKLADEGMKACRRAVALQSNSAPAHYYLALNLGQLMRSKGWGGIRYLGQLRREFETAAALDPKLDFAGPDRNLGYFFRDTPGFVGGSKRDAKKHLERAVQLKPDYPENRLALIEGLLDWDEAAAARKQLEALEALWSKARERLSGIQYAPAWVDWEERLRKVKQKLK